MTYPALQQAQVGEGGTVDSPNCALHYHDLQHHAPGGHRRGRLSLYSWWLGLAKKTGMVLAKQRISLGLSADRISEAASWRNGTLAMSIADAVDAAYFLSIMILSP